jgi:hypothetical protein
VQGFSGDPSLFIRWKVFDQNAFRPDYDYGGYGGNGESLLERSTNQIFVHGTSEYGP